MAHEGDANPQSLMSRLYRRDKGGHVVGGSVANSANTGAFNTRSGFKRPSKANMSNTTVECEPSTEPVFFKPRPKVRTLPPGVMPVMTQGLQVNEDRTAENLAVSVFVTIDF